MSRRVFLAVGLATSLFAALPAVAANAEASRQFDLVCRNTAKGPVSGDPQPAEIRIHVDLEKGRFCNDELCDNLTRVDASRLEYHCDSASRHSLCNLGEVASTAGPFVGKADMVVDRGTGVIHQTSSGSAGDLAPRHFNNDFTGVCKVAPFTALFPIRE